MGRSSQRTIISPALNAPPPGAERLDHGGQPAPHPSCGCTELRVHSLPLPLKIKWKQKSLAENAVRRLPSSVCSPQGPLQVFLPLAMRLQKPALGPSAGILGSLQLEHLSQQTPGQVHLLIYTAEMEMSGPDPNRNLCTGVWRDPASQGISSSPDVGQKDSRTDRQCPIDATGSKAVKYEAREGNSPRRLRTVICVTWGPLKAQPPSHLQLVWFLRGKGFGKAGRWAGGPSLCPAATCHLLLGPEHGCRVPSLSPCLSGLNATATSCEHRYST